jgi:hypothetical protein
LGVVLIAATVAVYWQTGSRITRLQSLVLLIFRLIGAVAVVLLLLQPSRVEPIAPPEIDRVTVLAIDNSKSMLQRDVEAGTRMDAAKNLLRDAELLSSSGASASPQMRMFRFSEAAAPLTGMEDLDASGSTTRFHSSVSGIMGSLRATEGARAIVLLSDGHDFELVNPAKTGLSTRARQTPIYAVPVGRQGKVRDASARITSYLPYTYVKQKAKITCVSSPRRLRTGKAEGRPATRGQGRANPGLASWGRIGVTGNVRSNRARRRPIRV